MGAEKQVQANEGIGSNAVVKMPAKLLLVLAAIISVVSSFLGGFIMYLEGLNVIEETVKEISEADTLLSARGLQQSFLDVYWTSDSVHDLLLRWNEFTTLHQFYRFLERDQFARTKNSENVYCIGMEIIPLDNTLDNPNALYQMVWWDPLTDEQHIQRNDGKDRLWVSGHYFPEYWGHPSCHDEGTDMSQVPNQEKRCVAAHKMHPETGALLELVYNYTDLQLNQLSDALPRWNAQQVGWRENGASFWRAASVWYSPDDTPNAYSGFYRTLPMFDQRHPLLARYQMTFPVFISFLAWQDRLTGFKSEAILVATFIDDGMASQVFGTNSGEELMKQGCNRVSAAVGSRNPCIVVLEDLSPTIQDAAVVLNRTKENTFLKDSISGGEHWLRRRVIHRANENGRVDELQSIHMLWLRPTSAVQDKINRGRNFFIGFVCGIFVFEVLILVIQLLKIGIPLTKVADAMGYIDSLDLDTAEEKIGGVADSCFVISEISSVVISFTKAIRALRLYKEYLPQSCLVDEGDDEEAEEALNKSTAEHDKSGRRVSRAQSMRSKASSKGSGESAMSAASSLQQVKQTAAKRLGTEVSKKVISTLVCNIRGLHDLLPKPGHLQTMHKAALDSVNGAAKMARGMFDGVVGDRAKCSWNAIRVATRHRALVAQCAALVQADTHNADWRASIGAAAGDALCGPMGTEGIRFFGIIGKVVSWVTAMERVAASMPGRETVILVDDGVMKEASTDNFFRWHMQALYSKRSSAPLELWQLMKPRGAQAEEEWMYQLEAASSSDPWVLYNNTVKGALTADGALPARPEVQDAQVDHWFSALYGGQVPLTTQIIRDIYVSGVEVAAA
eukprot:TRINITY_DN10153_c0_g2_i1.p1 TRINITY_DN10153_c0_g2~~TRINITY_DN10153_c0_g2_i1.p1  ORF type:complete len:846 (+),score=164.18 TRINITY_DN10153_c0_g2_i1:128-2665(+)